MNRKVEHILKLAGRPEVATLGLASLVLAALAAGCAAPAAESNTVQSDKERVAAVASPAETGQLVAGNSAFAFDLYQALRGGEGNLFFSPYSVSLALAMNMRQLACCIADRGRRSLGLARILAGGL